MHAGVWIMVLILNTDNGVSTGMGWVSSAYHMLRWGRAGVGVRYG